MTPNVVQPFPKASPRRQIELREHGSSKTLTEKTNCKKNRTDRLQVLVSQKVIKKPSSVSSSTDDVEFSCISDGSSEEEEDVHNCTFCGLYS